MSEYSSKSITLKELVDKKMSEYSSKSITLKELVEGDKKFNIPIYQRLYVWKDEQVKKLLEDTCSAFLENKPSCYLGNIIVVEKDGKYDLIDGQQRFTTLWLIAKELKNDLKQFITKDRLHFSIREFANEFFSSKNNTDHENESELEHIKNAQQVIRSFFNKEKCGDDEKKAFSLYLYRKVKLVLTVVPQDIDLNQLFENLNSSGIQLQHHELLKAKMLGSIKEPEERKQYAVLWDSCAFMENYVENNLAIRLNCAKKDIYTNNAYDKKTQNLKQAEGILSFIKSQNEEQKDEQKPLSLSDILKNPDILKKFEKSESSTSPNEELIELKVRSIISFSMLLLHTLRIFFKQMDKKDVKYIKEQELLKIFGNTEEQFGVFDFNEKNVKEFIKLLWNMRILFDKYIIKWVETNDDEKHLICDMTKSKEILQRNDREKTEIKPFSLLQSMLYHTQELITHYWLTPLLYYLLAYSTQKQIDDLVIYLQQLDNKLFFSPDEKKESLKERTWNVMTGGALSMKPIKYKEFCKFTKINKKLGTGFPHYLFYKVEYVLWLLGDREIIKRKSEQFYFRAKNSIEHIAPQTPKEGNQKKLADELLHSFGNLALVSRERNSEFSNDSFEQKQPKFKEFKDADQHLKMKMIYYSNTQWGDEECQAHLKEIKEKICEYLKQTGITIIV
jgi:uncharacterized protein with ParB-like and HNH nuclease domain